MFDMFSVKWFNLAVILLKSFFAKETDNEVTSQMAY